MSLESSTPIANRAPSDVRRLSEERLTDGERVRAAAIQINSTAQGMRWMLLGSAAGVILMTVMVALRDLPSTQLLALLVWCAVSCLGLLAGFALVVVFGRSQVTDAETMVRGRALARIGGASGLVWDATPWILLPSTNDEVFVVIFIGVALALVGSGGSLAIYRPIVLAFVLTLEAAFASGLFAAGEPATAAMSVLLLGAVTIAFARNQEVAVLEAIYLRFEKENLLLEITEQQRKTEMARKEAEAALQAAELANQDKTTFLAAAGHDLRQPMHALVQYFGHLQRRNRDPELIETVSRMGKALGSMQDLLEAILEVSKLMMGAVKPSIATVSVHDVLERIEAQMRPVAEDKGLHSCFETCSAYVETDEVLLERILRNLTLNAIRYTEAGTVRVRARQIGPRLVISIADTGIGIPSDERDKVFEAFYQVGNAARDRRKGLGLGLAIVRQLSELLSLKVRFRSRVGRGTVFCVRLPLGEPALGSRLTLPFAERDYTRGATVVLIDDNLESLDATAASLTEFGCRVLAASSSLEAINQLQGQETVPHLVISDYRLENETGLDAIRVVLENQRALFGDEFAIPALIVSGDTAPSELARVQEAGLAMLHKPLSLEALYAAVNSRLRELATGAPLDTT